MTERNDDIVVKAQGISKIFKDFWGRKKIAALTDVDIVIQKNSIFGLLGPNGAGKSTLIKIILGHLYPSKGLINVLGKSPGNIEIKYQIGYLPERSYMYKNLTALETLTYFGALLNLSKDVIKTRSQQLLEMVGLDSAKKRMIGEFSHGMTRRTGLAQALLNDPDFLILDEPTAGLDPVGCREVKDLILTLGKRGKTILLTSHLLADVEDVCDELLMLYGGKIQSSGTVSELLTNAEITRLEFPNISEDKLNQIKTSLNQEIPNEHINISSPKESLESYFLKTISAGSRSSVENYGAGIGKGVAEYLQDENYEFNDVTVTTPSVPDNSLSESIDTSTLDNLTEKKHSSGETPQQDYLPSIDNNALADLSRDQTKSAESEADNSKKIDQSKLDGLTK